MNEEQENKIDGVDILLVPVGGTYTIDGKQAVDVVNQIEPGIVIPMHYKIPGLKIDMANVSKFLKAIGAAKTQPKPKLRVLKKDIPVEGTEVVILNT
ncbi:MAG: Zn-dependent hydrolase of the beta-lactamase fold-like protein [uncultured bacterium]|nr:MAG: Zn-dependent hydrolase of the beta-lactamase fold-like protein [uncultured bacterium]